MLSYNFTKEDIAKSKEFSEQQNTSHYSRRNQTNNKARTAQVFAGKLGEIAAFEVLKDTLKLSEPDFQIYPPRQKSWKPDLLAVRDNKTLKFHVKTQAKSAADRYGLSWTFQLSDSDKKGGKDQEIFNSNDDELSFVIFVLVYGKEKRAEILSIVQSKFLLEHDLFKNPKLSYLVGIKKVVYSSDLEAAGLINVLHHEN